MEKLKKLLLVPLIGMAVCINAKSAIEVYDKLIEEGFKEELDNVNRSLADLTTSPSLQKVEESWKIMRQTANLLSSVGLNSELVELYELQWLPSLQTEVSTIAKGSPNEVSAWLLEQLGNFYQSTVFYLDTSLRYSLYLDLENQLQELRALANGVLEGLQNANIQPEEKSKHEREINDMLRKIDANVKRWKVD